MSIEKEKCPRCGGGMDEVVEMEYGAYDYVCLSCYTLAADTTYEEMKEDRGYGDEKES